MISFVFGYVIGVLCTVFVMALLSVVDVESFDDYNRDRE